MNSAEPGGKEETGEGRAVGAGRGRAPPARPPIPRPPEPPRARGGSGHVPPPSSAAPKQVPLAPLGGAGRPEEAAARPPPDAPARPPPPRAPRSRDPPGPRPGRAHSALRPNRYFSRVSPSPPAAPGPSAFSSCLGSFQRPHQREETQTMIWEDYSHSF